MGHNGAAIRWSQDRWRRGLRWAFNSDLVRSRIALTA
jgi:hypothetical protein